MTWSPSEGTSPEPTRRSKALTPPELGSSKNSDMADFEEEELANDKINAQVIERDNALLVVDDDDEDDEEEQEQEQEGDAVARTILDGNLGVTKRTVRW